MNGILVLSSYRRIITPNPRLLDGLSDETDYIEEAGCYSPSAMISSETGGQVTARIALTRKDELRFTVAYHVWESEAVDEAVKETGQDKNELAAGGSEVVKETGSFGVEIQAGRSNEDSKAKNLGFQEKPQNSETNSLMPVFQGKNKVGNVVSRMGLSDIGLAQVDDGVIFSNTFLDIEAKQRRLLASKDISYRDRFLVDSFVTGVQLLSCLGVRKPTKRNAAFKAFTTPDLSRSYVSVRQGMFATNAAEITGSPKIRDGICGAALVRLSSGIHQDEIGGFMVWSIIRDSNDDQGLLVCAEGWEAAELNSIKRNQGRVKILRGKKSESNSEGCKNRRINRGLLRIIH